MKGRSKTITWLSGEVKTPPFSAEARREMGALIRQVQNGELLGMPHSRPMPSIGPRCHELRVKDVDAEWRLVYRIDRDAVLVFGVFSKKSRKTPKSVIDTCKARLKDHDQA